jgi:hypothetical protein
MYFKMVVKYDKLSSSISDLVVSYLKQFEKISYWFHAFMLYLNFKKMARFVCAFQIFVFRLLLVLTKIVPEYT